MRGEVAVIPVHGPIVRYADLFTEISGGTSVESLSMDFHSALENPRVKSILLDVDSPGGSTNGINEFAQMVFEARGEKKIIAYTGNMAASAGYWIASAADEIITDSTAMIGSIGVIAAVNTEKDPRKLEFISNQSPKKRPDPTTAEGKKDIQTVIDSLADVFVSTVARNRGVTEATVLAEFGQGGIMVGTNAVQAGLADRLGSFEQVIAELNGEVDPPKNQPKMKTNTNKTEASTMATADNTPKPEATEQVVIDRDFLNANHAGLVDEIKAEGATSERERVVAIEAAALPGHADLLAAAKADGSIDAGAFALQQISAEQALKTNALKVVKEERPDAVPETNADESDVVEDISAEAVEAVKDSVVGAEKSREEHVADWEASEELQKDWVTSGSYAGWAMNQSRITE